MTTNAQGKVYLSASIKSLNINAHYRITGDDVDINTNVIEWEDDTTPISNEDIVAEQKRLQDIEDAKS
tara:strand:+ start:436 stop:639 length:204 start_codon:yes stop_codon:yes gene_type:complete